MGVLEILLHQVAEPERQMVGQLERMVSQILMSQLKILSLIMQHMEILEYVRQIHSQVAVLELKVL